MLGERGLWYKMHWFEMAARVHRSLVMRRRASRRAASALRYPPWTCCRPWWSWPAARSIHACRWKAARCCRTCATAAAPAGDRNTAEAPLSPLMMIRRGDYKFIYSESRTPACSTDLRNDPQERENLAASPAHRGTFEAFLDEARRRWDIPRSPAPYSTASAADAWWPAALARGRLANWDHQPWVDASQRYMPTISTWTISSAARASRNPEHEGTSMNRLPTCLAATLFLGSASRIRRRPRLCPRQAADPGWSDIAVTNATAAFLLESLGYQVKIDTLSVPIIYGGLRDGQVDAFLGWMPAHQGLSRQVRRQRPGRTPRSQPRWHPLHLAVPRYVWDAGVHRFEDLAAQGQRFNRKLRDRLRRAGQSVDPEDDRRQPVRPRRLEAGESSEQAMLAELGRAGAPALAGVPRLDAAPDEHPP